MAELDSTPPTHAVAKAWKDGNTVFVRLTGELDLSNAEQVRSVIEDALTTDVQRLVFEVGELTFMDSSGIALLAVLAQKVPEVELHSPPLVVRRLIELTRLDQLLRMDP